jgi:cytochrome c-type biogenesis protein CcmH
VANQRAVELAEQLRCLVCQNQTIADSNAELAVDLRRQIREQIAQGKSDAEITGFMVERYGDFVLYRPPLKATTLLLWLGPPVLLLAAIGGLLRYLRERRKRVVTLPLSDDERRQAQQLLGNGAGGKSQ